MYNQLKHGITLKPKKHAVLYQTSVRCIFSENHDLYTIVPLNYTACVHDNNKMQNEENWLMSEINTIKNFDGKIKRLSFFLMSKQCMVICIVKHTNKQITYTGVVFLYLHEIHWLRSQKGLCQANNNY